VSQPLALPSPAEAVPNPQGTGLEFLLRSLRRHWRGIAVSTVALSAVLIAGLALVPPKYSASATLMVESRPNVVNIQDVLPALTHDVEGLSSEIEILRSRELTKAVAERLEMTEVPGAHASGKSSWAPLAPIKQAISGWFGPSLPSTPEERVTTYLLDHLDVKALGKSRVIEIRFTASTPELARNITNAFASAYADRQVIEKTKASLSAKLWVDAEIDRVRQQVQADERQLEDFRARSGLLDNGNKQLLPYGQVVDLDHRLSLAESDYAATRARVEQVRKLEHNGTLLDAFPETIGSPALQQLRQQEAKLTIDLATLTQHYGPDSDRVRRAQAEISDLRQAIRGELGRISAGLESEASLAASEVASLRASEGQAKKTLEDSSSKSVALTSLQREVDAGGALLTTLLKRQNELAAQASLQTADAQLISPAPLPHEPSFPKFLPMSLLAILGSAALSIGVGVVRDMRDRVVRSTEDLLTLTPFHTLGLLPRFQTARGDLPNLATDRSRYAESVKNLYVQISPPEQPMPRSIVVTSALPGEGKTTTAVSLAMLAASLGRNVVLVDFDTRRPSIHHILRLPLGPGLLEYMSGEVSSLREVIQFPLPNLTVITAGRGGDVNSVVRAERVEAILTELTQRFDQVIIDTPPCLAVVDSLVLARLAERVVHVVRWGVTRRESVRAAAQMFDGIDRARIGIVLSQVDIKRHAADGYGDSAFYHQSLNRYYLG